jgi:hypothetical protein
MTSVKQVKALSAPCRLKTFARAVPLANLNGYAFSLPTKAPLSTDRRAR